MKYLVLFLILISFFVQADAYLSVPPTPAFKMINSTFGNVTARNSYDYISFVNASGINITPDYSLNTFTFEVTASGGGINNTISSIGTQQSIVSGQVNNDHQLKGIACGGDLQCSNNSTDVTISFTETGIGSVALDDLTDVILTSPAQFSILLYDGANWLDQIFKSDTITCAAGQFFSAFDNQTGDYTCSSPIGSGFTTIASEISPSGNATVLSDNNTGTRAVFKTISAGTNIQVDNGSQTLTIKNTMPTTSLATISTSNATILADNSTTTNKFILKTLAAGTGIQIDNGSNTIIIKNTGPTSGPTTLSGANITTASATTWIKIWDISMTASSGSRVDGNIIASTAGLATAVQFYTNMSTSGSLGTCLWATPTGGSTVNFDLLNASGSATPAGGGTGETAWGNVTAVPVTFDCSVYSGVSPATLGVFFRSETAGQTVSVLPGSFYIKTP